MNIQLFLAVINLTIFLAGLTYFILKSRETHCRKHGTPLDEYNFERFCAQCNREEFDKRNK